MRPRIKISRPPQKVDISTEAPAITVLSKEERFLRLEYLLFGGPIESAVRKTRKTRETTRPI